MPATLLAVDDSVTMRKVLEMTFAGEDFRVVTADSADAALAMVNSEDPALVLADVTLPGKTGYDLCTAIKRERPDLPVLLLSSKLHPYDTARGQAANADDHIDKPFDTQKLIDKVNGLLSGERKVQTAPKAVQTPYRAPAQLSGTLIGSGPPVRVQPPKSPPVSAPARPAAPTNLRATADFAARPVAQPATPSPSAVAPKAPAARAPAPPATTAAASPPPAIKGQAQVQHPAAPAPPADPPAIVAAAGADMAAKLSGMGLTPDQVQGVLALSQEVVERVVWEVVPVLAETMIKEELKRLTAD